jgi:peptidoglycan hydrolase FlgJ
MTSELNITAVQPQANEKVSSSKHSAEETRKLRKACADFESIFTYQLLKTMRKTIPESKTGMNNYGKDTYTMMMDQKLAESISSKANGLGLQKALYEQLTKNKIQETIKEVKNTLK